MTTPNVFSTKATESAKKDSFGAVRGEKGSVSADTSVDTGDNLALIRFQDGFSLNQLTLAVASGAVFDSGTALTLKVGYLYDDSTLTENDDAFFTAADIAQTGGGTLVWPSDSTALQTTGFTAQGSGYISVTIAGSDVNTTDGVLNFNALFTYDE